MYTLTGTAKLNGIDPPAYLTAVLMRINNTPITEVAELLPWNLDLSKAKYGEAICGVVGGRLPLNKGPNELMERGTAIRSSA